MCARLLACPLCSQPGFLTLDALRAGLISVATRPLTCPVCNEILLGIDKLTIHLFSHTINLSNNNTTGSLKHTIITSTSNPSTINNLENTTSQDWDVSKVQITDSNKLSQNNLNNQNSLISSQSLQNTKDKASVLNSEVSIQDQNLLNHVSQITFLQNSVCGNKEIHAVHRNKDIESDKDSQQMLQETIKLNYATEYFSNENVKHVNFVQNYPETEYENVQTFKTWMQDQHCEQQNENVAGKVEKSVESDKSCNNEQMTTMYKLPNIASTYTDVSLENANDKNVQEDSTTTCNKSENESFKHKQILPELKFIKTLPSAKQKTECCNICGFHFPDHNILFLHKQLVHMIHEKDLNTIPENLLKNYSCHLCSKVFKMRGSLMVHMRVAHMGYNLGNLALH